MPERRRKNFLAKIAVTTLTGLTKCCGTRVSSRQGTALTLTRVRVGARVPLRRPGPGPGPWPSRRTSPLRAPSITTGTVNRAAKTGTVTKYAVAMPLGVWCHRPDVHSVTASIGAAMTIQGAGNGRTIWSGRCMKPTNPKRPFRAWSVRHSRTSIQDWSNSAAGQANAASVRSESVRECDLAKKIQGRYGHQRTGTLDCQKSGVGTTHPKVRIIALPTNTGGPRF
jgi:hypothetical protein